MKKIYILLAACFVTLTSAAPPSEFAACAQPNNDKSVLYLLKGDSMSRIIYNCWAKDPKWHGNNPSIIWVGKAEMTQLKKKYCSHATPKK
jgi:hypothetical protein